MLENDKIDENKPIQIRYSESNENTRVILVVFCYFCTKTQKCSLNTQFVELNEICQKRIILVYFSILYIKLRNADKTLYMLKLLIYVFLRCFVKKTISIEIFV